jgi:hypothetical protein
MVSTKSVQQIEKKKKIAFFLTAYNHSTVTAKTINKVLLKMTEIHH